MQLQKPKVAIIIIHYNTPDYLKTCLGHIFDQSYKNIEVFFIDNNSPDRQGVKFVKKYYRSQQEEGTLHIIENKENTGYSGAADQGVKLSLEAKADYIVITNPDIIYSPTYFEKVIAKMEKNPHLAGITGKVYKYDFAEKRPTKTIDTVGLYIDKTLRVRDGGQGDTDEGQFDTEKEVFGISGACPLYRAKAIEDVKVGDEYFDRDFFMYKEDVDISWRLILRGWKFLYYPKAIAFHGRGTGVIQRKTNWQIFKNRKTLSKLQRFYSYRNQKLMMLKNLESKILFKHFFRISFNEIATFFYILLFEPRIVKAGFDALKMASKMLKKRKIVMKNRKQHDLDFLLRQKP